MPKQHLLSFFFINPDWMFFHRFELEGLETFMMAFFDKYLYIVFFTKYVVID